MELQAVIGGLELVPDRADVLVNSDCTVIWSVLDRWKRRVPVVDRQPDADLWVQLRLHFSRLGAVEVRDLRGPIHKRCHAMAQAEARALSGDLGLRPIHLPSEEQARRASERRARRKRAAQAREQRLLRKRHLPSCSSVACAPGCTVFAAPFRPLGEIPHREDCVPGQCDRECFHYKAAVMRMAAGTG